MCNKYHNLVFLSMEKEPRFSERIQVVLDEITLESLQERAKETGLKISTAVRKILVKKFNKENERSKHD